jgi:hypothetical protein
MKLQECSANNAPLKSTCNGQNFNNFEPRNSHNHTTRDAVGVCEIKLPVGSKCGEINVFGSGAGNGQGSL